MIEAIGLLKPKNIQLQILNIADNEKILDSVSVDILKHDIQANQIGQVIVGANLGDIPQTTESTDLLGHETAITNEIFISKLHVFGIDLQNNQAGVVSYVDMVNAGLSALLGIHTGISLRLKTIQTLFGPVYVIVPIVDKELNRLRLAEKDTQSAA